MSPQPLFHRSARYRHHLFLYFPVIAAAAHRWNTIAVALLEMVRHHIRNRKCSVHHDDACAGGAGG